MLELLHTYFLTSALLYIWVKFGRILQHLFRKIPGARVKLLTTKEVRSYQYIISSRHPSCDTIRGAADGLQLLIELPNDYIIHIKYYHGAGTLALPGGHLEKFETWEEYAMREVMEVTGLKLEGVQFGYATNNVMIKKDKHCMAIFVMCECMEDENGRNQVPRNLEPEKCDG